MQTRTISWYEGFLKFTCTIRVHVNYKSIESVTEKKQILKLPLYQMYYVGTLILHYNY